LVKYFHDREIWLLKADVLPQRVVRYPVMASGNYLTEARSRR